MEIEKQKQQQQFVNLPENIQISIISYLSLKDFLNLSLGGSRVFLESYLKNQQSPIWKYFNQNYLFSHPSITPTKQDTSIPIQQYKLEYEYNLLKNSMNKQKILKDIICKQLSQKLQISLQDFEENLQQYFTRGKQIVEKFYGKLGDNINKNQNQNQQKIQIPLDLFLFYQLYDLNKMQEALPNKKMLGTFNFYDVNIARRFALDTYIVDKDVQQGQNSQQEQLRLHQFALVNSKLPVFIDVDNVLKQENNESVFISYGLEKNIKLIHILNQSVFSHLQAWSRFNIDPQTKMLDMFDSIEQPSSDAITHGVQVRTAVKFLPSFSQSVGNFFYSYQVRISDAGVEEGVIYKLLTRKWVIFSNGQEEVVEGEGVIGYYPEMYQGCEDFVYQSCCPIQGFEGKMKGHFVFEKLVYNDEEETYEQDQETPKVEIQVAEFQLKPKDEEKLLIYDTEKKTITNIYPKLQE